MRDTLEMTTWVWSSGFIVVGVRKVPVVAFFLLNNRYEWGRGHMHGLSTETCMPYSPRISVNLQATNPNGFEISPL